MALRLYQHIAEQDPQNVDAQQRIVVLSQKYGSKSTSVASSGIQSEGSSQYSKAGRKKSPADLIAEKNNSRQPTLASKSTTRPKQPAEEVLTKKSRRLEDQLPQNKKKTPPMFEVAERPAPGEAPSAFEWANDSTETKNQLAATTSKASEKVALDKPVISEQKVLSKVALEPGKEKAFGDELLAAQDIEEQKWWNDVFETGSAQPPQTSSEMSGNLDAVEVAAAETTRQEQSSKPTITTVKSDTPSLETVFEERKSEWKTTSVQRLCDADASDELIQVVSLLDSKQPTERIAGLIELGDQGLYARAASPAVRALLHDNDALVRAHAAGTVHDIEGANADVVRHLQSLLQEDDVSVLRLSAYLLGQMGSEATPAIADLERLRDTKDSLTSLHAAEALTRIAPEAMASYEVLQKGLNDEQRENRLFSAVSLGSVRQPGAEFAAKALKAALKNEDADVRATVALSLGGLGTHAEIALEDLQHVSEFDTPEVRDAALTALACLGK
ncbi:HEAT repeat domain-containing protein [Thalassoglobus polymorphus]|uniref:HEAT repeat domain-containing protein n=1 Tax=Thalassoglobus polymorphus TaxID=2527994 RepID=UPI0018D232E1|nr:HEAT repeat domain-containing protein [Thalassoglobus polymorphus]